MARSERDVKGALEVARAREDSAESKLLRASRILDKARRTRKRLAGELRKIQAAARERMAERRASIKVETLDLDALGPLGPPNGQPLTGEEVDRG
jgi:hypothetical protein